MVDNAGGTPETVDPPVMAADIDRALDLVHAALLEGLSVRCPGPCRALCEKNHACIHIRTCGRPNCHTEFCYGCVRRPEDCEAASGQTGCPGGSSYLTDGYSAEWRRAIRRIAAVRQVEDWAAALTHFHLPKVPSSVKPNGCCLSLQCLAAAKSNPSKPHRLALGISICMLGSTL